MGADGGCMITKISDIRNSWKKIKYSLIESLENELNMSVSSFNEEYIRKTYPGYIKEIKSWPDSVRFKTNRAICDYLQLFRSCDCPYLFDENYIVTGYGNYVNDFHWELSYHLPGIKIETWT